MSNEITWGDPIPVNGKRPEWLRDDEMCLPCWGDSGWYACLGGMRVDCVVAWQDVSKVRLLRESYPADIIGYRKKPVAESCEGMPPVWAIEKARSLLEKEMSGGIAGHANRAFARYIAKHEQPPVDPLAQEAERLCIEHYYSKIDTPENLALAALRRGIEIAEERRAGE